MKNSNSFLLKFKLGFLPFLIALLSFSFVSCEKEAMDVPEENAELNIYDLLAKKGKKADKGAPSPGDASIAEIAIANEDFNELVAALSYVDATLEAGLVDLFLNGNDQYTVFAPTDQAFFDLYSALGDDVNGITDIDPELVLNVLLYHVTEGRRASNSVVPRNNAKTIQTLLENATFNVDNSPKIIAVGNSANFEAIDISASNGIIHIIDSVLLPIVVE